MNNNINTKMRLHIQYYGQLISTHIQKICEMEYIFDDTEIVQTDSSSMVAPNW